MTIMKKIILDWFSFDRTFKNGVTLYFKFGMNSVFKRRLNNQGYTKENTELLYEEFRKLTDLSIQELTGILNTNALKRKGKKLKGLKTDNIKLDVKTDKTSTPTLSVDKKEIVFISALKKDYPFLADINCDFRLVKLYSRKWHCWWQFRKAHSILSKAIVEPMNNIDLGTIASDVIDNFIENQQIFDELEYYKKFNKILGNHKIFRSHKIKQSLKKKSAFVLNDLKTNALHSISRNKLLITKNKKPHLNPNREKAIEKYLLTISVIDELLQRR